MSNSAFQSGRSVGEQFYNVEDVAEVDRKSTYDRVVELINQASLLQKAPERVTNLKQAQELIIHREPDLLDNFMDEMLAYQQDKAIDVRKFVVGFIEEACKNDPAILPQLIANVNMMLSDEAIAVVKRVIQSAVQLYKITLAWICHAKVVTDMMESTWACITDIKTRILTMIDSENDGIRTHAIKFLEMIVIVQTYPEVELPKKSEIDVTLEDVPLALKFLKPRKLEEEAKKVFESLVKFHGSPHISSVNLMTCMGALTTIAKLRSEFLFKVVQAFEALQVNLPPTLARSQVISVRKQLKLQLLCLLKQPASVELHPQITTLLSDLGASDQEVQRNIPKLDELPKKRARPDDNNQPSKRTKVVDSANDDFEEEKPPDKVAKTSKISKTATNTAIDITAKYLIPLMTSEKVVDVVTISMVITLPEEMPDHFQSNYTPIAAAGTTGQIEHLARLLAAQLTSAGLGPGFEEVKKLEVEAEEATVKEEKPPKPIQTVVGGVLVDDKPTSKVVPLVPSVSSTKLSKRPGVRQLKLSEITKPLTPEQSRKLAKGALRRIIDAERAAFIGGAPLVRLKALSWLVTYFNPNATDSLLEFIFEDVRGRAELLLTWLYEEYSNYQGFSHLADALERAGSKQYDRMLCSTLTGLLERSEQKDREILFVRILTEAPLLTDGAVEILKTFCQDETRVMVGIGILKDLVVKRPTKQLDFLSIILELTGHDRAEVRNQAIKITKQLHERVELQVAIEEHALMHLKFLLMSEPPSMLFGEVIGRTTVVSTWTEDMTRVCLHLYLVLLPVNHKLVHDLAQVYVATCPDIKRMILRVLENPVKGMGMNSPELLTLVESCPKGAETLVTRIIHILTDRAPPSAELVARVRDLYHKRVPDVRFLIPVLNGLSKKEVVAALPKLIKLNPVVVKEVFNRLLGGHGDSSVNYTSPLTPAELLIALHSIDSTKCDMKTIIKATSMCFGEKHIYTQEVLAVVMQQLMEQSPLPTLLMRTVLQSLSLYPRLIGFVMNILQRLILKQVWKQKKVWEGFIKCCQRTKPQSFQVLLQLPAPQLQNVFETSPELREPLLIHVNSFTQNQRAHISQTTMDVLNGVDKENEDVKPDIEIKKEPLDETEIKTEESKSSPSVGTEVNPNGSKK